LISGAREKKLDTMKKILTEKQVGDFRRDGCLFPVRVMSSGEAAQCYTGFQSVEATCGGALSGPVRYKPHLLITWLNSLVRHPKILDAVEDIIGPNILCWASSFFNKDAHDPSFVSWHQDSTYWGLSQPDVVTAWVAFTPSRIANGCMRVIPGTHMFDQMSHADTDGKNNLLSRGQEVEVDVDESQALDVELEAGEISLHHVRLIHGSPPNLSDNRRIGYAIRYIPTHIEQLYSDEDTASLVRGEDQFHNFVPEPVPSSDMDPAALKFHAKANAVSGQVLYRGSEKQPYFSPNGTDTPGQSSEHA